ncbi:hypothetical protein WJX64_04215 [Leifsonia sp. YIM 134122]|uniref:Uncharacterized protein n=1 Tax=Leifsonia stereocauli TaxID=3134136 RepID=A0ABU9W1M8_9MICO
MSDDTAAPGTTLAAPVMKPLLLTLATDAAAPVCEGDSCSF